MKIKSYSLLLAGPALLVVTWLTAAPLPGMSESAWHVTGLMLWMILWWISEVMPIPVTSILPMIFIPLLGIDKMDAATAPYAHPLIFLFFGGFFLSIAMEKTGLHQRIALKALQFTGQKPSAQVAGLMAVTAFLSMWMSNTATAVMMLPIAMSIVALAPQGNRTALAPLLKEQPSLNSLAEKTQGIVELTQMLLDKRLHQQSLTPIEQKTLEKQLSNNLQIEQEMIVALIFSAEKILNSFTRR